MIYVPIKSTTRRFFEAVRARPFFAIATIAGVVIVWFFGAFPHVLAYRLVGLFRVAHVKYNSSKHLGAYRHIELSDSAGAKPWVDPTTGLTRDLRGREIEVGMSFSPALHAPKRYRYYDLLATAPENRGLRLEYGSDGTLSIIVAAHNATGYVGYLLSDNVEPNRWHTFHMTIDRYGSLAADLDGREHIAFVEPDIAFAINDITIGTGFSDRRPFFGSIKNGTLNYAIYDRNPFAEDEAVDIEAFGLLIVVSSLYFFIGPESWSGLRWSWNGRPPWSRAADVSVLENRGHGESDVRGHYLHYIWPLPDDSHAFLDLKGPELTHRALGMLARNITSLPHAEIGEVYSVSLCDGLRARIQFGGKHPPTKRAFEKLADYVRDLASFAGT